MDRAIAISPRFLFGIVFYLLKPGKELLVYRFYTVKTLRR
jgi:hypothetical protein